MKWKNCSRAVSLISVILWVPIRQDQGNINQMQEGTTVQTNSRFQFLMKKAKRNCKIKTIEHRNPRPVFLKVLADLNHDAVRKLHGGN